MHPSAYQTWPEYTALLPDENIPKIREEQRLPYPGNTPAPSWILRQGFVVTRRPPNSPTSTAFRGAARLPWHSSSDQSRQDCPDRENRGGGKHHELPRGLCSSVFVARAAEELAAETLRRTRPPMNVSGTDAELPLYPHWSARSIRPAALSSAHLPLSPVIRLGREPPSPTTSPSRQPHLSPDQPTSPHCSRHAERKRGNEKKSFVTAIDHCDAGKA